MSETGDNDKESEPSTASSTSFVPGSDLYTDFASDSISTPAKPVQSSMVEVNPTTPETQGKGDKNNEGKQKKPNRKDWIDTENPLHCKPCNYIAKTIEDFQDHSLSYRHIKKTAEVLEMKMNHNKDEEKKKQTSFTCEICVCTCNSETAWNSHLVGQKHRKNLEKQGAAKVFLKQRMKFGMEQQGGGPLFNKAGPLLHGHKPYQKPQYPPHSSYNVPTGPGAQCANDFAQYKEPLIGLEYVTEIQVTGQSPRYHCKLCDAKFDHNVKFPHLVGAKHRFNVLKEKNPAIAQEIRIGVKKRSQLTGKLLDEARKIEEQEGRQHVKTCVEASPFDNDTSTTTTTEEKPSGFERSSPFSANKGGLGRELAAPFRPYQKPTRGHPIKGSYHNRGGQKRPHIQQNYQTQFESTPQGYGNPNQPYNSNMPSFGADAPPFQAPLMRGRGGRGRGFRGANQGGRGFNNNNRQNEQAPNAAHMSTHQQHSPGGLGRGYNNKQNRPGPWAASTNTSQQNTPGGFGRGNNNKQNRPGPWATSTDTSQQHNPGGIGRGYNNKQNRPGPLAASTDTSQQHNPGGIGRGYNNKQNRPGPWAASTDTSQQNNPGSRNNIPYLNSTPERLLPREAFASSTPSAPPPNYSNKQFNQMSSTTYPPNSNPGQTGTTQPPIKNESPAIATKTPPTRDKETTQDLLKGLTDLGKLVSSEEDASIALQVSNALTQALLKYRMQNFKEDLK